MEILAAQARTNRLLLFAGAGISMPPPTSLPDWYTLNDTILQALARRLTAFTPEEFSKDVLAQLLATRNSTRYLSPDYQAQIMEDECGAGYFRVLQALDTGEHNHCHNGIAALAAGGFLGAIVTTNFDRLIEHALTAAGVPHCVFHDYAGFEQLHAALAAPDGALPVIKVHGSVEAPDSMVDTLRQRLMGRPESLEGAIGTLIARHHVVFAGFSGADLAYDQGYLGLQAAASNNQGFTCLLRPGEQPKTGMAALKSAWGANSRFLEAMLPDWLDTFLGALDTTAPPKPAGVPAVDRLSAVATHADQWSNSLGHMIAVAIMAELLESTGRSALAFDLLRRTYQTFSAERDMEAPGYARFNYQLGHRLLERGTFNNAIDWQHGRSSGPNVSPFTVNDCFQCLNRASGGNFPQGEIDMGLYEAYWGMPQTGAARIREVRKRAAALPHPIGFIDACRALAIVYEILMQYADGLDWLEQAHRIAQSAGDAPRRARVCAEEARFLAMKQRFEEGHARIGEGQAVAGQLGLGATSYELLSAEGSLLVEERRPEEAMEKLDAAAAGFRELGYRPALLRCLIDVCYAAFRLGRQERLDAAMQELFPLTAILPGYKALAGLMLVRFHHWNGDEEGTREWIANTRKYCERYENPGMIEELEIIERKLDR